MQVIVESVFEGALAYDIAPASICKEFFNLIDALDAEGVNALRNIQSPLLIVVPIISKISFHFCKDCRIFCEGE